jgi:hypothetical protein
MEETAMARRPYAPGLTATALLALCLGAAACHPKKLSDAVSAGAHVSTSDTLKGPVAIPARLDCPEQEGQLKRASAAGDGRRCDYTMPTGVVELSLVEAANGDTAALAPFKAAVDAALPRQAHGASATVSVSSEKAADGRDVNRVDMPFIHVSDDGRRSHVKILGMSIDSDSDSRHHDDEGSGASNTVADAPKGRESVYLLAGDPATPEGYHAVGYVARSDGQGRMVVALFRSRKGGADNNDHDLDALLQRNASKG